MRKKSEQERERQDSLLGKEQEPETQRILIVNAFRACSALAQSVDQVTTTMPEALNEILLNNNFFSLAFLVLFH